MNLLFQALRQAIDDAAKGRGLADHQVVWKHRADGAFFIGIVSRDPRLSQEKLESARERALTKPRRD